MVPALLTIVYGMLGVDLAMSAGAAIVFGLATQWWPGSVTTFDQNQHAVLLFVALLLAWESGRRAVTALALLAGVIGGALITYQETYGLLLPAIALAVFAPSGEGDADAPTLSALGIDRSAVVRSLVFGAGCCVGVALFFAYNYVRFDALFQPDRYDTRWPANPLAGVLSLTISPGRSVFLFSPPLLILGFGIRSLWTRAPVLCAAAGLAGVVHFLFVSNLPFFAGEWAWGPRYLLVLLPLACLGLPFAMARLRRRYLLASVLGLGLVVQLMAVSLDHQRFYFERGLAPHFWGDQPWFYFERSQLLARPFEIVETLLSGVPAEVVAFAPTPHSQLTYAPFGPPRAQLGAAWARRYAVFHVFRPWPFWMAYIDVKNRPVPVRLLTAGCVALVGLGAALMLVAVKPWSRTR